MADVDFSDLISQYQNKGQNDQGVSFDDLIAAARPPSTSQAVQTGPAADLPMQPWHASVLPVGINSEGKVQFEPSTGFLSKLVQGLYGGAQAGADITKDALGGGGGLTQNEIIDKAAQAASVFGVGINPAVRAGDLAIPGAKRAWDAPAAGVPGILQANRPYEVAPPSRDALFAAGNEGFNRIRSPELSVDYNMPALQQSYGELRYKLNQNGFNDINSPQLFQTLDRLQNPEPGAIANLQGVNQARESFGVIADGATSAKQRLAANMAKDHVENFIRAADPATVAAGPAREAADTLEAAIGNWAAASRSKDLGAVQDKALLRAAAQNSGLNIDSQLRQQAVNILTKDPARAGYNPDEIAALEEVAKGTAGRNTMRYVGNFLGGGGGLGAVATAGAGGAAGKSVGGPILGILSAGTAPLAGWALRKGANAATMRALDRVDELVRSRSPLMESLLAQQPLYQPVSPLQRSLPVRGLLDYYNQGNQ